MSEQIVLTDVETTHMTDLALRRGYDSLIAYIRALVAADELVETLREDWHDADESVDVLEASFREAWHDAMTGHVHSIETLWDEVEND